MKIRELRELSVEDLRQKELELKDQPVQAALPEISGAAG